MKATELVGKDAIRTAPAQYPNGNSDCSYMSEPIHIAKATDAHIVFFHPSDSFGAKVLGNDKPHILNACWCDDNWTDYEELITIDGAADER